MIDGALLERLYDLVNGAAYVVDRFLNMDRKDMVVVQNMAAVDARLRWRLELVLVVVAVSFAGGGCLSPSAIENPRRMRR